MQATQPGQRRLPAFTPTAAAHIANCLNPLALPEPVINQVGSDKLLHQDIFVPVLQCRSCRILDDGNTPAGHVQKHNSSRVSACLGTGLLENRVVMVCLAGTSMSTLKCPAALAFALVSNIHTCSCMVLRPAVLAPVALTPVNPSSDMLTDPDQGYAVLAPLTAAALRWSLLCCTCCDQSMFHKRGICAGLGCAGLC